MKDIRPTFSYTARKGRFLLAALPFLALALVETGVAILVLALFTHGTLRTVLLAGWSAIPVVLAWSLSRSLRTRHGLTANHLALRFGPTRLDLERGEIVAARPISVPLTLVQPLRAEVEPRKRRLVAAFSDEGQILLTLAAPRQVAGRRGGEVVEVLLNADRPEELLAALDLPPGPRDQAAGGARARPLGASARRAQTGCAPSSPGPSALPRRGPGGCGARVRVAPRGRRA